MRLSVNELPVSSSLAHSPRQIIDQLHSSVSLTSSCTNLFFTAPLFTFTTFFFNTLNLLFTPAPIPLLPTIKHTHVSEQCSRLKSSMSFKLDLAFKLHLSQNNPLQNATPLPKSKMKTSLGSPQYNLPTTRTNKCRASLLQEMEFRWLFSILHIILKTYATYIYFSTCLIRL